LPIGGPAVAAIRRWSRNGVDLDDEHVGIGGAVQLVPGLLGVAPKRHVEDRVDGLDPDEFLP
jgi:hypothetical protein